MVGQSEWLLAKLTPVSRTLREGRRALGRDRGGAQAVGDEQDDVLLRLRGGGRGEGGEQQARAKQRHHRRLPVVFAAMTVS